VKLPKHLSIAPFSYTVREDKDACVSAGVLGYCLEDVEVILIDPLSSPGALRDTLLHESLHAIWGQTTLNKKYSDEEEEEALLALSPRILSLIRDNPKLVSFLTEEEA